MLKDPENYELYDYRELGRGDPVVLDTGREICSGEYSGISGFSHIMGKMDITFNSKEEAEEILELVRFANVQSHKPLVDDELHFIAKYPEIVRQILTQTPP